MIILALQCNRKEAENSFVWSPYHVHRGFLYIFSFDLHINFWRSIILPHCWHSPEDHGSTSTAVELQPYTHLPWRPRVDRLPKGRCSSKRLLGKAKLEPVHCTWLGAEQPQQMEETQMATPRLRHHPERLEAVTHPLICSFKCKLPRKLSMLERNLIRILNLQWLYWQMVFSGAQSNTMHSRRISEGVETLVPFRASIISSGTREDFMRGEKGGQWDAGGGNSLRSAGRCSVRRV